MYLVELNEHLRCCYCQSDAVIYATPQTRVESAKETTDIEASERLYRKS